MAANARLPRALNYHAWITSLGAVTPLRLRLTGAVLAGLLLILAGLIAWDLNRRSLAVATAQLRNLDLALAEELLRHMQLIDRMLTRTQNRIQTLELRTVQDFQRRMTEPDIQEYLADLLGDLTREHGIALFDAAGQFLVGGHRDTPRFAIAERAYFRGLQQGSAAGPRIEVVGSSGDNSRRAMIVANRVTAPDGTFLGAVLMRVNADRLLHFYNVLNAQQRIGVTLVRPDGEVLIRYPPDERGPAIIPKTSHWYDVVARGGGTYRSTGQWTGVHTLVAAQPLRGFPVVLDIAMREDDILQPFQHQTRAILATGAVISLMTLWLFWMLARQIQLRDEQNEALVQSGDALRASESRLRDFAEMASDWYWEQDADLRLSWVSEASPSLMRHNPARIGKQRWEYCDTSSDPAKWQAHRQDLVARRAFGDFRYEQAQADGATRYFSISGRPRYDESGTFLGYRGIGRHITAEIVLQQERDRARGRAERAESLLRDALDSLSESVVIYDEQDRLVMTNEVYRRRYPARSAATNVGKTFGEIVRAQVAAGQFPEAAGNEEAWLATRLHLHRAASGGFERQLPDGGWIWLTERRMRSGGTVTLHVDITQIKRTEIALRRSEERLDLAQSVAGIGSWEQDLRTNTWFWSKQMYRIRGLDPEAFTPTDGASASPVDIEDLVRVQAWLADLRQGEKRGPIEQHITRPDGIRRLLRLEGKAIADDNGVVTRIVGTSKDITERQQIEQQLAHAMKMEALGTLTGGMAHDFNNVLSIVINNLELAQQDLSENDRTQEWLRDALDAALRGADLTQSLLAFARRQPLKFEPLNLNDIVTGMQRLLSRVLGENIVIRLDLSDGLWTVVSDRAQIEASITNLATNARDAMLRGGNLTITTSNQTLQPDDIAEFSQAQPGDYCVVTIIDTGVGMSPDVADRIFEPFFTTKQSSGGTGLGLSMVFGFIKQSGGHISVQSGTGAGTEIRLFLPRARAEVESPDNPRLGVAAGANEVVLVVEDNAPLRRVVTRQISGLGYRVFEAADAVSAMAILSNQNVDLLFTDVVMPGTMDGIELARQALMKWPRLCVLLTSGFTGRSEEQPVDGQDNPTVVLRKPYRRDALAQALRRALANEPATPA